MMLKAELHTHCWDDPIDYCLNHSAKDLIKEAANQDFDILSITLHDKFYYPEKYQEWAEKHGILLIPGVELQLEGCDVLVYNITKEEAENLETLQDLKKVKRDDTLIVAPHPFLPFTCSVDEEIHNYHHLFDAIEHVHFYTNWWKSWNEKAEQVAEKYDLSIVGNSDVHNLWQLGTTYTKIKANKKIEDIFSAVKNGDVEIVSQPLNFFDVSKFLLNYIWRDLKKTFT